MSTQIQIIGVVGAGQMGQGIAQVAAQSGFDVLLFDAFEGVADKGRERIARAIGSLVEKGRLSPGDRDGAIARLRSVRALSELSACDLVIESVTEKIDLKLSVFRDLDGIAKPGIILASNTSSISITRLAAATGRPDRVAGLHFFNPVPLMKLVEIVRAAQTHDETHKTLADVAARMGKTVITSKDVPGFIVNRVLMPLMIEAIFELQEGIATPEDIDTGARLGLGHPMGPLELCDLVGLDTVLSVADVLLHEFGDDKYRAPVLLRNYVAAGWLGRKTGRGFYRYDDKGQKA